MWHWLDQLSVNIQVWTRKEWPLCSVFQKALVLANGSITETQMEKKKLKREKNKG